MGATRYQIEIYLFIPDRREEGQPDPMELAKEMREQIAVIVEDPKYACLTPFVL